MVKPWIGASALSLLAAIAREIIGLNTVLSAASGSNMDRNSIVFYHIGWHVITGFCFMFALIFFVIAIRPEKYASSHIAWALSSISGVSAAIVLVVGLTMGWANDMLPPVLLFSGIAALGSVGAIKSANR